MGKTHRQSHRDEMMELEDHFETIDLGGEMEPRTGQQQLEAMQAVVAAEVNDELIKAALTDAYVGKTYLSKYATDTDRLFAAKLGIELRVDKKGRQLALQAEDLPAGADLSLRVLFYVNETNEEAIAMARKEGIEAPQREVVRTLGSTLRFNKSLGMAIAAGRAITDILRQQPSVVEQSKLLSMELRAIGNKVSAEKRREVFAAFYAPYTYKVRKAAADAYLAEHEPRPKTPSRIQQLRGHVGEEAAARVDELLARLGLGKGSK